MAPIDGSRESPIALDGTDDEHTDRGAVAGQKRKRYLSVTENGKKRKIIDVTSFHPRLQTAIDDLKAAIAKEDWSNKGKFPPNIKPILAQTALLAVELDEYDDDFFNLMPTLFPYNKFTMTKLIKRTIFVEHTALLVRRQDALLEQLGKLATEGFKKAEEDWQNAVVAWDRRQEKARQQKEAEGGFEGTSTARTGTSEPPGPPTRPGSPAGDEGEEGKNGREPHPPSKKYRMTDAMKNIVWELVLLSNESCRLENEKKYGSASIHARNSYSSQSTGELDHSSVGAGLEKGPVSEDCCRLPGGLDVEWPDKSRWYVFHSAHLSPLTSFPTSFCHKEASREGTAGGRRAVIA